MIILSIQSHVAYGHVGNSAAVFPMQRIGCQVWPVHTVQYSNHTGYGRWRGRAFSGESVRMVVEGIEERGVLGECDGVISGYLPSADTGEAMLDIVARVKSANPAARYCCDPVIGDARQGMFVKASVAEMIRDRLLPIADIVTPNHFELDYLIGRKTVTRADALGAIDELHARGPRIVLITSLQLDDTPEDSLDLMVSDGEERFALRTPRLPVVVSGSGDALTALFFARHLADGSASQALSLAASSIFGVLNRTAEEGAGEMLLIEAQDQLVKPSRVFKAKLVR
jgi:pyridoxine kinase